ncbi:hypothetical protein [Rugosimonospora africana]|uniref:Uncharacterized protein n=1 Tax=Rugosimonospora africana TaxID=556532 RepID=A0A8J3R1W8_9ACTN|nr:hypothetical protein [Rugosimonospora africana]GIH18696.1 hypothetical protein Raf01_68680 [Rugosimonospora africana]
MPDKRAIHQAKSKGRRKTAGGSGRGAAIVTGPDTDGTVIDRSMKQDNVASAGTGRMKKNNGR